MIAPNLFPELSGAGASAAGAGLGGFLGQLGGILSAPRRFVWNLLGAPESGHEVISNLTGDSEDSPLKSLLGMGLEVLGDPLTFAMGPILRGLGGMANKGLSSAAWTKGPQYSEDASKFLAPLAGDERATQLMQKMMGQMGENELKALARDAPDTLEKLGSGAFGVGFKTPEGGALRVGPRMIQDARVGTGGANNIASLSELQAMAKTGPPGAAPSLAKTGPVGSVPSLAELRAMAGDMPASSTLSGQGLGSIAKTGPPGAGLPVVGQTRDLGQGTGAMMSTSRVESPLVLQAARDATAGPLRIEHVPIVKTADDLQNPLMNEFLNNHIGFPNSARGQELTMQMAANDARLGETGRKMQEMARGQGLNAWDLHPRNVSQTSEGAWITHDPGAVLPISGPVQERGLDLLGQQPGRVMSTLQRLLGGPQRVRDYLAKQTSTGGAGQGVFL